MLTIKIPDKLSDQISEMAEKACQTPEEYIAALIEEHLSHESAYKETEYLAKSESNEKRLDKAVEDIKSGKYETHNLMNSND